MIFAFLKNWKFILDVLIVLVIIAALFIWNPFGIFGGKAKLVDTANMVTEIRNIGQLVTAEYYGEVISSLDEARMEYIEDENVQSKASSIFSDMLVATKNLREFDSMSQDDREKFVKGYEDMKGRDRRRIVKRDVDRATIREKMDFFGFLEDLEPEGLYLEVLEFWYRKTNGILDKKNFDFDPKTQDEALFALFDANLATTAALPEGFMAFYYDIKKKELTKKELRKKIAMIGRGWVKAGFDFTDLDPSALVYHESQQEIHIMGLAPSILNADINPWFIPEKGIPGFEILDVNGRTDFRDAKKVKEYCIRKLRDYAHRANILENAERQGEETLKNLFSLLTGKEIKRVVFHHDAFVQYVYEIEKDSLISRGELAFFDSLYRQKINHIDSLRSTKIQDTRTKTAINLTAAHLKFAINRLKKLTVFELGEPFNFFSYQVVQMAEDGTIDEGELDSLTRWRKAPKDLLTIDQQPVESKAWETPLWFDSFREFTADYNSALRGLSRLDLAKGAVVQGKYAWSTVNDNPDLFDSVRVINLHRFSLDSVLVNFVMDTTNGIGRELAELYYPFQFDRKTIDSAVQSIELKRVLKSEFKQDSIAFFYFLPDTGTHSYGFPMKFEALIFPELAEKLKNQGGIKADGYRLVFDVAKKDSLPETLSLLQETELRQYLYLIEQANHQHQNRSVFKKFTGYINGKLDERSGRSDWYSRLKKKL